MFLPKSTCNYQDVPLCYSSASVETQRGNFIQEKIVTLKDAHLIWLTTITAKLHLQPGFTRTAEVFHYLVPSTEFLPPERLRKTKTALCCVLIPLPVFVTVSIHRIQRWEKPGQPDRGSLVQGEVKVWPLIKRPDFISS